MKRIRCDRKRMRELAELLWLRHRDAGHKVGQSWRYLFRWATGYWDLQ